MTALNKQALREAAEKATKGEWAVEFNDEIYSTDGVNNQQIAMVFSENEARDAAFIAAANPATMLALQDENLQLQRDKDSLEAAAIAMRDDMREAREKLEAAEKRIAELEARVTNTNFQDGWVMVPINPSMAQEYAGYKTLTDTGKMSRLMKTRIANIYRAMITAAAGIGVKGE